MNNELLSKESIKEMDTVTLMIFEEQYGNTIYNSNKNMRGIIITYNEIIDELNSRGIELR